MVVRRNVCFLAKFIMSVASIMSSLSLCVFIVYDVATKD